MRALTRRPMTASLRYALLLTGITVIVGVASPIVIYWQDGAAAKTNAEAITGGHVQAGKMALGRYNCGACHSIPGIMSANGKVGPPLNAIGVRTEIAGALPNTPDNLVRWIRTPQQILPGTGMPNLGVTERDARDMAAYLYTVRR